MMIKDMYICQTDSNRQKCLKKEANHRSLKIPSSISVFIFQISLHCLEVSTAVGNTHIAVLYALLYDASPLSVSQALDVYKYAWTPLLSVPHVWFLWNLSKQYPPGWIPACVCLV